MEKGGERRGGTGKRCGQSQGQPGHHRGGQAGGKAQGSQRSYRKGQFAFERTGLQSENQYRRFIVAANPHMTAIIGADDHTREDYPGVFIAGIRAEAN